MRISLRIANIFSWFSLVFWGVNLGSALLSSVLAFSPLMLGGIVLFAAIPLHSYAALQLHKSIRRPEVKLSHQTPVGIRFVGLVAMFFGFIFVLAGITMLQNAPALLNALKEQEMLKDLYAGFTVTRLREMGVMCLVLGLIIIVNVILNLRLLRWYYLVHQSDAS